MQERVVFAGQNHVFEDASEELAFLTGVEVTAKQVERLTHAYGSILESEGNFNAPQDPLDIDATQHYGMIDGGMILTREDDWKELKLARLFPAQAHLPENEGRNFINNSTYVAHLGGCTPFFKKLEETSDHLRNVVWICDGAKWIWNWIGKHFPESTQILDYYHCSEKLHEFAREAFKSEKERKQWTEDQENLLNNDQVEEVIENINAIECKGKALELQRSLLTYYENNTERMRYKTFKEQGLLVGSGAMEAAHRHVIQTRMKQSGQRWTIKGAQQIANLRVANKSGNWDHVLEHITMGKN